MVISSLRRTSEEYARVCLEDGTEIPSTAVVIAELLLFTGKDLDEETLEQLHFLSQRALAQEKAIKLLSYTRMSSKELRDKLVRKGTDASIAEAAVEKLQELRLLDDAEYAAAVVRHYTAKGYGAARIRAELSRRGVDRDLWEEALENAPPSEEKIDRFVQTKLKDPDDREQVRKVTAALYRRGYSWDEIRAAINRYTDSF